MFERNNTYYFSRANQQKACTKIYSLTQCSLTVNGCDWHILAGNDERINSHCLTRLRHDFTLYWFYDKETRNDPFWVNVTVFMVEIIFLTVGQV